MVEDKGIPLVLGASPDEGDQSEEEIAPPVEAEGGYEVEGHGKAKRVGHDEDVAFVRVRIPHRQKGEIFAIAEQLMGGSRIKIVCEDGKSRMARIPGKMKKRRWIRTGDLLVVKPWEFQNEKADVVLRYTKTEALNLVRRGVIPDSINVF